MIEYNNSLYIFGGQIEGNFETNEFWCFDIVANTWTKIHGFHQIDDPLQIDSPDATLKGRWKSKNKTMGLTLKSGISLRKQSVATSMGRTTSSVFKKTSPVKPVLMKTTRRKKQWELPPFGEEQKVINIKKGPESPITMIMSNSIVLKCYSKRPLKEIYQGPEMRSKGDILGRVPRARDGHAAVAFDNKMVIFGGDRHQIAFDDIHYYILG